MLFSDDTRAMIAAAEALGAEVKTDEANFSVELNGIFSGPVTAQAPTETQEAETQEIVNVYADKAGTVGRFLLPVLAAREGSYALDADDQLQNRPIHELIHALRSLGARITSGDNASGDSAGGDNASGDSAGGDNASGDSGSGEGSVYPLVIQGKALNSGPISVRSDRSSQFLSGLLLASPAFSDGLTVSTEDPETAISRPYVEMTVAVMEAFGASVSQPSPDTHMSDTYVIAPGGYQPQKKPTFTYRIEPDATAAGYFWAAAAITGGKVRTEGLDFNSLQGDVRFATVLEQMGCEVREEPSEPGKLGAITVQGPTWPKQLAGGKFDLGDISDNVPTLAAVAAFASSSVTITGVGFIRAKESDRIGRTVEELCRRGVAASELDDGMTISPALALLRPGRVATHDDHRMAMAMSLLGLRVANIEIDDPECVSKTFPDFFEELERLRRAQTVLSTGASVDGAPSAAAPTCQVIAIDGPAASGKSSVARAVTTDVLGRELSGYSYLDTGAMYRSVAWAALQDGIDLANAKKLAKLSKRLKIEISYSDASHNEGNQVTQEVKINGQEATEQIRSPEVDRSVSMVAAHPQVRKVLVKRQREWIKENQPVVMEGRDIGSVVCPEAALKIFLTATPEERSKRRSEQRFLAGSPADTAEADALASRDKHDSSRDESPLQVAPNAVILDTSELVLDQVVDQIAKLYSHAPGVTAHGVTTGGVTKQ